MTQQTQARVSRRYMDGLLWCFVGLLLYMPFHGFVSTWGGTTIGPLVFWKALPEIILITLLGLLLFGVLHGRLYGELWARKSVRRLLIVIMLYSIVSLAVTFLGAHLPLSQLAAGLGFGFRYIVAFVCALLLVQTGVEGDAWKRIVARYLAGITVFLAVFGLLQVTILPSDFLAHFGYSSDTISPTMVIDQNQSVRRAFATTRGPNDYGALLLIPLSLAIVGVWRRKIAYGVSAAALAGIAASGSRSAWLGAALVLAGGLVISVPRTWWRVRKNITMIAVVLAGIVIIGVSSVTVPALRLAVFHSSPGDSHLTEGSTDKHWLAVYQGISDAVQHPLGCGLGCAGPASYYSDNAKISENYYVQIAQEVGIVGVVIWCALFVLVMRELYRYRDDKWARALFLSGVGIAVIGLLLHVWADSAVSIIWWGMSGLVIGNHVVTERKKSYYKSKHEQKTKKDAASSGG